MTLNEAFLEYEKLACDRRCKTYYPNGAFQGYLVPHEETITIAQALEVVEENRVCYRPTVMFLMNHRSVPKRI